MMVLDLIMGRVNSARCRGLSLNAPERAHHVLTVPRGVPVMLPLHVGKVVAGPTAVEKAAQTMLACELQYLVFNSHFGFPDKLSIVQNRRHSEGHGLDRQHSRWGS